jgi:translocation protein SEC63
VDENDKEPTCDAPESVDKRKLMVKVDAAKNAVKLPKYRVIFANHSRLALIVVLWIVFTWALVSAWQAKINFKPYDPFEILNVPSGSSEDVIKSAFKKLSRVHHPDKAAPENRAKAETKFVEISKAYKSLTDEKMRKNWEEHGNPDGIRTFALGVALPSWLVNSSNRMIVLALYCLAFGIGLPLLVKQWWSKSKHYTKDGLCHSSMSMFFRDLKENSSLKKILEMLANATEFVDEMPKRLNGGSAMEQLLTILDKYNDPLGDHFELPKKALFWWFVSLFVGAESGSCKGICSSLCSFPPY